MKSFFSLEFIPLNLEGAASIKSGDRVAMNETFLEELKLLTSSAQINAHLHEVKAGKLEMAENTSGSGKDRRVEATGFYFGVRMEWTEIENIPPYAKATIIKVGLTGAFVTQAFVDHIRRASSSEYEWEFVP